jgi:release factor glutamine methyltransferase
MRATEGSLGAVLREGRERLAASGIDEPDLNARLLMEKATGLSPIQLLTGSETRLDGAQQAVFEAMLQRRLGGEPAGRILGQRDFWGLRFTLSAGTLEPRPDSEIIVEEALTLVSLRDRTVDSILDLGTGTGCLLIALLSELPSARGHGVDISADAVKTARNNAHDNRVAGRCTITLGSWGE